MGSYGTDPRVESDKVKNQKAVDAKYLSSTFSFNQPLLEEEKKKTTKADESKSVKTKKETSNNQTVRVTLVKSFYGRLPKHRATVTGLGLKRINHIVEHESSPQILGMVNVVNHLVRVEK